MSRHRRTPPGRSLDRSAARRRPRTQSLCPTASSTMQRAGRRAGRPETPMRTFLDSFLACLLTSSLTRAATVAPAAEPVDLPATSGGFAPMFKKGTPCVVTVFSSRTLQAQGGPAPWMDEDPVLRHFFGGDPRASGG